LLKRGNKSRFLLSCMMFIGVLCSASINISAAPSVKQTQYQVKQLKKTLDKLQSQLKKERAKRSSQERAIQKSEQDIAALGLQIKQIEQEQQKLDANLAGFLSNKSKIEAQLVEHRQRLAKLIQQRYQLVEHTPIKLLLNQKDPQHASRMLAYLDIIRDYEAKQVLEFESVLAQKKHNDQSIDDTQAQLAKRKTILEKKRKSLQSTRLQRRKNIDSIDSKIASNKSKIKKVTADRKRLLKVIKGIEKAIVLNKAKVVDNRPFKKLKSKLKWPVSGKVVRSFGSVENSLKYDGILIRAKQGSAVKAVHTGHVVFSDWLRSYGMLMIVDHGAGYLTLYGHNDQLNKKVGDKVNPGETIALVGSSGGNTRAGLYFAIRHNGKTTNPRNWLAR